MKIDRLSIGRYIVRGALLATVLVVGCSRNPSEPAGAATSVQPTTSAETANSPSHTASPPEVAPAPPPPSHPAAPMAPAGGAGAAGTANSGADVVWTDPPGWVKMPASSSMRKATYQVPKVGADPENAEVAVFYFGKDQGGGVEENMSRWTGQFSDSPAGAIKRSERSVAGMKQWIVEDQGTFGGGMPGQASAPKKDFALVGGIVETPVGKYFFKMTGPKNTVRASRDGFFSMLDSLKMP